MLHDGKHSFGEAWSYLQMSQYSLENEFYEKHGFHMNMSYAFLYPERITPLTEEQIAEIKNNRKEE